MEKARKRWGIKSCYIHKDPLIQILLYKPLSFESGKYMHSIKGENEFIEVLFQDAQSYTAEKL